MTEAYALIGAAGYVAPRHMEAIRRTGGDLVAALDPNDSVSIIDSYYPDALFFTEFERFERHIAKLQSQQETRLSHVSICSPSYLHDSHIRFALRAGVNAICENPLVLNPWNIDGLSEMEVQTGMAVNTLLQLRLHPAIVSLRDKIQSEKRDAKYEVDLGYVTARGRWYLRSWHGAVDKSGGIATAAGIHFFDVLCYLFGSVQHVEVHMSGSLQAAGYIEFENARVRWFLSLDIDDVPKVLRDQGQRTYRSVTIDGEALDLTVGSIDLHTLSYQEILAGRGFRLNDNRAAIEVVSTIRSSSVVANPSEPHPLLKCTA